MRKMILDLVPGLVAGAVGGFAGYLAVGFLIGQTGFWVPILPGALAGLACGQVSRVPSKARGALNGLIALGLATFAQWKLFSPPFKFDGSFPAYVAHLHQLPPVTLIILAINGLLGYWWGREERIGSGRGGPKYDKDVLAGE